MNIGLVMRLPAQAGFGSSVKRQRSDVDEYGSLRSDALSRQPPIIGVLTPWQLIGHQGFFYQLDELSVFQGVDRIAESTHELIHWREIAVVPKKAMIDFAGVEGARLHAFAFAVRVPMAAPARALRRRSRKFFLRGGPGCMRPPDHPCALGFQEGDRWQSSGAASVARMRMHVGLVVVSPTENGKQCFPQACNAWG
jgi:hypothetical protein